MIAYSIAAARLTKNIDRVIVSTDSQKYADIAAQYGAEVPFLRPVEISGDTSTDYLCIKHALDWLQDQGGSQPEYLVHLRPTTPLRDSRCIEDAIELLRNNEVATALRSVHEMSESAYKTMEIETGFSSVYSADRLIWTLQMITASDSVKRTILMATLM